MGVLRTRLVFAIISTILEEVALAVIVLWWLPRVGINIPVWGLVIIMIAWVSWSVYIFRKGTRALKTKDMVGMPDMIGTKGKVVSPLAPEGLVRIRGELWVAKSTGDDVQTGQEITVVDQERLKLLVDKGH